MLSNYIRGGGNRSGRPQAAKRAWRGQAKWTRRRQQKQTRAAARARALTGQSVGRRRRRRHRRRRLKFNLSRNGSERARDRGAPISRWPRLATMTAKTKV